MSLPAEDPDEVLCLPCVRRVTEAILDACAVEAHPCGAQPTLFPACLLPLASAEGVPPFKIYSVNHFLWAAGNLSDTRYDAAAGLVALTATAMGSLSMFRGIWKGEVM